MKIKFLVFLCSIFCVACAPKPTLSDNFDAQNYREQVSAMKSDPNQNPEDLRILEEFFKSSEFKAQDYQNQTYRDVVREAKKIAIQKSRTN